MPLEIIDALLKHKADLNIPGQQGITPLHAAILQGTDEAVKRLLRNDPAPDIDAEDCDGDTPLHVSSRVPGKATKSIQLVLKGANLRKKNSSRHTSILITLSGEVTKVSLRPVSNRILPS